MNKMRDLVKKLPIIYPLWHEMRVFLNQRAEKKKREAFISHGREALNVVMKTVIKHDIPCVVIAGTLLGLVREGHLLTWDDDLDFSIVTNDYFDWLAFEKILRRKGIKKYRSFIDNGHITGMGFRYKGVLCDFSLWNPGINNGEILYSCEQIVGKDYKNGKENEYKAVYKKVCPINELEIKRIDGIDVKMPSNYLEVLVNLYGENWMIPDKNYSCADDSVLIMRTETYYTWRGIKKI